MIWYRYKLKKHVSLDSDFLDTAHTQKQCYRWNEAGVPALYLADSFESALAECGKYKICERSLTINQAIKSVAGRPPREWLEKFKDLSKIEVVVARIEVPDSIAHLDFVNDPPATNHFSKAGFSGLTMSQIKQSSYVTIPGEATMKIGTHYYNHKVPLIRVPSARAENGICGVLFQDNIHPERATVLDKQEVALYALDGKGYRIDGKKIVPLDENTFEYEVAGKAHRLTPMKFK